MKHFAIISVMLAVGSGLLLRGLTAAEEKAQSSHPAVQGSGSAPAKNSRARSERQPCAVRRS